ncbi:MAG TPA: TrmH family RNA methyltransferase [Planctomycetota bacterium]|jgi:TrmH family RNA methyltransferase|nr:TrmH family RNA methyltransferase [Planctomycetota bacterium]
MKRVVLVRPSGPRNVGMILRAAANFGPCEVFLVAPERPSLLLHPDFEQMSHGVEKPRERCTIVATLAEALAEATHSIGFSARSRDRRLRVDWRAAKETLVERANDASEKIALVFGNEVTGFVKEEAAQCAELVHIATTAEHTSLNLAIAVSIVLSDLFVEPGFKKRERNRRSLSGEGRKFLGAAMSQLFGERIARTPSAKKDILAMIERFTARAPLEDRDARAWHLVLRALGSQVTPKDLGIELHTKRGRRKNAVAKSTGRRSAS